MFDKSQAENPIFFYFGLNIKLNLIYNYNYKEVNVLETLQISLAAARVNARLTQKEAAKRLKISKQTLVNWERGISEPKASQSYALSILYNIPLDNISFCKNNQI